MAAPAGTNASAAIAVVATITVFARLESVADGYIVFPSVRVSPSTPVLGEPMRTSCIGGRPVLQMMPPRARMLRGRAPPTARLAVMGTISVIVPCLNDAGFLGACLDALALQTRPADEIVVVDNGSTDATAAVARSAGARVVDEPMRGIWPATAAGFDAASGDLLARLDADSVPAPDWLAEVERRMAAADRPTAVTGSGQFYGGNVV